MNEEILKKALEELNAEGFLKGTKITEKGKAEAESIIRAEPRAKDKVFMIFWRQLESLFYELSPNEFCLKVLELEKLLKKSVIDLFEKLKNQKF